jgi:hypothetical protein
MLTSRACPICQGACTPLDAVDLNKACNDGDGKVRAVAGVPIHYFRCEQCGFCFAPEFADWQLEDFEAKIYNDDYIRVDPDYLIRAHAPMPAACWRHLATGRRPFDTSTTAAATDYSVRLSAMPAGARIPTILSLIAMYDQRSWESSSS